MNLFMQHTMAKVLMSSLFYGTRAYISTCSSVGELLRPGLELLHHLNQSAPISSHFAEAVRNEEVAGQEDGHAVSCIDLVVDLGSYLRLGPLEDAVSQPQDVGARGSRNLQRVQRARVIRTNTLTVEKRIKAATSENPCS